MAAPTATARAIVRSIVSGSPACAPQATFTALTRGMSSSSRPMRQGPKLSPASQFSSMRTPRPSSAFPLDVTEPSTVPTALVGGDERGDVAHDLVRCGCGRVTPLLGGIRRDGERLPDADDEARPERGQPGVATQEGLTA